MVKIDGSNICSSEIWKRIFFTLSIFSFYFNSPRTDGHNHSVNKTRRAEVFLRIVQVQSRERESNKSQNRQTGKNCAENEIMPHFQCQPSKKDFNGFRNHLSFFWVVSRIFLLLIVRVFGGRLNRSESILINKFQMRKKENFSSNHHLKKGSKRDNQNWKQSRINQFRLSAYFLLLDINIECEWTEIFPASAEN